MKVEELEREHKELEEQLTPEHIEIIKKIATREIDLQRISREKWETLIEAQRDVLLPHRLLTIQEDILYSKLPKYKKVGHYIKTHPYISTATGTIGGILAKEGVEEIIEIVKRILEGAGILVSKYNVMWYALEGLFILIFVYFLFHLLSMNYSKRN